MDFINSAVEKKLWNIKKKVAASLALKEYITLLHLPTTSCILAFAIMGSVYAPVINLDRFVWILLQLFLMGGVAANYLDEIQGRPWHTKIPKTHLWIISLFSLIASNLIGIYLSITFAWWFWLFTVVWVFFTIAYDLELFNGRFHNTPSLALSWGSVCLGSYYLQSFTITPKILIVSLINGCLAGYGRNLYEVAKPFCKDKNPFSSEASRFAWTLLKKQILFVDILAVVMLTLKLLT